MTVRSEPQRPDLADPAVRRRAKVELDGARFAKPDEQRANRLAHWAEVYGDALLDHAEARAPRHSAL